MKISFLNYMYSKIIFRLKCKFYRMVIGLIMNVWVRMLGDLEPTSSKDGCGWNKNGYQALVGSIELLKIYAEWHILISYEIIG